MEDKNKRWALFLGGRIVTVFLTAITIVILVAYYVLSQNFQSLLTNYTIKLVEAMAGQGVEVVENELESSRKEAVGLAKLFQVPEGQPLSASFPQMNGEENILRMTYVSEKGNFTSDKSRMDMGTRPDIDAGFLGEDSFYGPFFNEKGEYVICYSAPVWENGKVSGVFSVEKDGYRFCELIKTLQFASTGESYLLNAEGTDIAVSRPEHIEWVTEEYNARKLYAENPDEETLSIIKLEEKGLQGESGVGNYDWDEGRVYVVYKPIPSAGWVLLTGLREKELASMTQSVLYASISKGPVLAICLAVFLLLTALIVFWIVSSMGKYAKINEKLKKIAGFDSLTGLRNRNSYHEALDQFPAGKYDSLGCVYTDVNGLHEVNNRLGHQAGDEMLRTVADVLQHIFLRDSVYRIGGDEFVVFCVNQGREDVEHKSELARQELKRFSYEISVGVEWRNAVLNTNELVNMAEEKMLRDKRRFYQENGKERQSRELDHQLEQMVLEKNDADTFLSVLAPEFKGVYFADLGKDTIRHLYIPSYFAEMLKETGNVFSKALSLYACRIVTPEYRQQFELFCGYQYVEDQLNQGQVPELIYQKSDHTWMRLRIFKFKDYTDQSRETLWIFSSIDKKS